MARQFLLDNSKYDPELLLDLSEDDLGLLSKEEARRENGVSSSKLTFP